MSTRDKQYKKAAKAKAKEYLRIKKKYRSKEEKKAFKIAEKFRIAEWKKSLAGLEASEAAARMKAYRYYCLRKNFLAVLIAAGLLLAAAVVGLIILL